ncbi:MAG TPA: metallophosphoesterase [Syntrophales bacterium]|nr:metallophosphoesterase [Syntrophales bacterium]
MRRLAHLSDLHFGREDPALVRELLADLRRLEPTLVAVSGDLTQRARRRQFLSARAFLERIPFPKIVVPGNHDIPLYDPVRRFLLPLHRWRRYIAADMDPVYIDAEMAVLGVNTARSLAFVNGRISDRQIALLRLRLCSIPDHIFKIVVTHHPFIPPPFPPYSIVGRASKALNVLEECGVDLLLAGHYHVGYSDDIRSHHETIRSHILVSQASTLSRRVRREPAAYNVYAIDPPDMTLTVRAWNGKRFVTAETSHYKEIKDTWSRIEDTHARLETGTKPPASRGRPRRMK